MSSSTFKGRYKECSTCTRQIKRDGKFNCNLSHSKIRNNANGVGIKYERYFIFCGMYDKKTTKVEKKKIGREELVVRTKIDSLLEVYNDLGTMKWAGADETWDNAIEAVRKDLFSKIKKSLRKTDRVDSEYPVAIYYKDK